MSAQHNPSTCPCGQPAGRSGLCHECRIDADEDDLWRAEMAPKRDTRSAAKIRLRAAVTVRLIGQTEIEARKSARA